MRCKNHAHSEHRFPAPLSETYVGNQCLEFANHAVTVTNRWAKRCSFRVHSTVLCSHPSRACAVSGYQLHTALRQAPRLHIGAAVGEGGRGAERRGGGICLSHPCLKEADTTVLFGTCGDSGDSSVIAQKGSGDSSVVRAPDS